ncbi:MAG: type I DNA topoisomerase [Candidatus Nitrohelix vancouverensis]|uniref:DNA topoisomerase 1 n=1 Tax=Candidatus Nitrohelix vancouverensis TaxID=2705534 RepID=A0A7T0G492_9BACT|nr:MAG: type I DNA topoisomerase [Candidatus Nitrohelix vancouverensis]
MARPLKSLVIVESPTKVKTLNKILGSNFIVKASVGHLKDLPKKKLGVDVDNDFSPQYITIRGKGKILSELKAAAKKAGDIYLAPDPDREGEAIAYHVGNEISKFNKGKVYRVLFNEITKKAVSEAIKNPTELNENLVNAQQARRILDRLVGYQISPILWKKVHRGLSAGRVQSVALRLVCEREKEIQSFESQEYWTLILDVKGSKDPEFQTRLFKIDGEKAELNNKEETDVVLKAIENASFVLEGVVKKERKRNPSAPFITSSLQQEASRKLNFSPKKTMMLAQRLYEGITLGKKGTIGLITYMRTDSTRVADEAIVGVRSYIEERYGKEFLPATPNQYKNKKAAQEAHEAIRPTDVAHDPKEIKEYLESDLLRLYELIWLRFVSSQMSPAIMDTTQFDIKAGSYLFRSNGSVMKFAGFMKVYVEGEDNTLPDSGSGNDRILPDIAKGEVLKVLKTNPEQHFTQPPPRFTEAMLVKELEEKGVGRPSTYASIISVIKDRDYVRSEERRLQPSELGTLVSDLLVENFPDIMSTEFTAKMEDQLDQIEEGKVAWVSALKTFYTPFKVDLEKAEEKMRDIKGEIEETGENCDKCDKPMIIKWGRFGKFQACSGYPDCKNTREVGSDGDPAGAPAEEVEGVCDKCQSPLVIKMGRFGKFIACSTYPDCKFTKPISLGIDCPEADCKGYISSRRSKKGRTFYGCSEYPNCTFTSWDKPVPEPCPECENPFLVEKWKKNEGASIICPKCKFKKDNAA